VLTDWGYRDRHDDVRLCVSELATNALLHGVPPGREFCLALATDGPLVRIEVRDSGDGHPEAVQAGPESCGGRGIQLVMAVADDFGVTTHNPGKTVWAVLKTAAPEAEEAPCGAVPAQRPDAVVRKGAPSETPGAPST
jgi:anti-sigma regulatory factor (Ser/Thr protein kinase)